MHYLGMLGVNLAQVALFMEWRFDMRWYEKVGICNRTKWLYEG